MSVEDHASSISKRHQRLHPRSFTLYTRIHTLLYRLTGGVLGGKFGKNTFLLLTTIGRKSGKRRTTPLIYLAQKERFLLVASNRGVGTLPNWWLNVRATTRAQVQVGPKSFQVTARQASQEERQQLWPLLVANYPDYERYQQQTAYPLPIIILQP